MTRCHRCGSAISTGHVVVLDGHDYHTLCKEALLAAEAEIVRRTTSITKQMANLKQIAERLKSGKLEP